MKQQTEASVVKRTWRGESTEERQQQRRERLLEAATEAFAKYGISKTTMRDICGEARLTERYFYESFRSTEDAFDAVYAKLKQELVSEVTAALTKAPKDLEQLASAGLRAFYTYIKADPRRAKIMLIDAFAANQRSREKSRAAVRDYINLMGNLATTLYPKLPKGFDIELLAWGLIGLAIQVGTVWSSGGFKQSIDKVLAYNLYAWRGLGDWAQEEEQKRPAPQRKAAAKNGARVADSTKQARTPRA
jgi:AcrR family transcriptional regulator